MSIKQIAAKDTPGMKSRKAMCHALPEWQEVVNSLHLVNDDKALQISISTTSLKVLGKNEDAGSIQFGATLRRHFKDYQLHMVAWARNGKVYVKKVKP